MRPRVRFANVPALAAISATLLLAGLAVQGFGPKQAARTPSEPTSFAARISALSEPEGYFDTDNLISNEQSYLTVLPELQRLKVRGGAYIGVGPDQNFSYIADVKPEIAFIVDIRRDNLLLHLLFKALFAMSGTRIEYLSLLCGRQTPADLQAWRGKRIGDLTEYLFRAPAQSPAGLAALKAKVTQTIRAFGVSVSSQDLESISRFHGRFIEAGLDLQFQSFGRAPQSHYPTFGQLLLAQDGQGRQANYLATEDGFQFVKGMQGRDLIIPVVGDLSGPAAVRAVGNFLRGRNLQLTAFYASNVEFYLYRGGAYTRFLGNLNALPRAANAVIIRSLFGGRAGSISETQAISELLQTSR